MSAENICDLFSGNYSEENNPDSDVDNTHDLCDRYMGKWVDVTTDSNGSWYSMFDGTPVTIGYTKREDAVDSLITWIKRNVANWS